MFHTYMAPIDISTRSLQKGSAEFLVLSILDGPDRHGYELAQIIETRSGGRLSFKAATLYPLLYKLEKQISRGRSRRSNLKWTGAVTSGRSYRR
jgi:hypothetical protein